MKIETSTHRGDKMYTDPETAVWKQDSRAVSYEKLGEGSERVFYKFQKNMNLPHLDFGFLASKPMGQQKSLAL